MPANDKEAHVPIWFTLKIGGAEAAGFFKEATGFDSESEVIEIKRSMPNGRDRRDQGDGQHQVGRHRAQARRRPGQDALELAQDDRRRASSRTPARTARSRCSTTTGSPVVTYSIINAWPKKYTGVGLKADSNEVAVEGITLCHEGFEIQ